MGGFSFSISKKAFKATSKLRGTSYAIVDDADKNKFIVVVSLQGGAEQPQHERGTLPLHCVQEADRALKLAPDSSVLATDLMSTVAAPATSTTARAQPP
jgi:hypothetical protein